MRKAFLFILCVLVFATAAAGGEVKVTYLGHSCFTIAAADGTVIMIDPYFQSLTYPGLPERADIVLVTHEHGDHNAVGRVLGNPTIVRGLDTNGNVAAREEILRGIPIEVIPSSHGSFRGQALGANAIFRFTVDGVRFAHLGDIGAPLTPDEIAALGEVDVLFVPVGGAYTVDAIGAIELVRGIPSARIVIPMHYLTSHCPWKEMAPVDPFLSESPWPAKRLGVSAIELTSEALPAQTEVWLLEAAE
jgi:L-ascorbate metabolism protein UlaG (beta-lactamase superfamily)